MRTKIVFFVLVAVCLFLMNLQADMIVLDSGKSIEGDIVSETPYEVVVKLSSGVTVTIAKDEIKEIRRKADLIEDYKKKRAEVRDDNWFSLMELAKWCKERGLKDQQKEVLQAVLKLDPEDPDATRELALLEGKLPPGEKKEASGDSGVTVERKGDQPQPEKAAAKPIVSRKVFDTEEHKEKKKKRKTLESKFKPKGTTQAALKGLNYLAEKGWRVNYAPQGQVVAASFAGLAFIAAGSDDYSGALDKAVTSVIGGVKRYCTGQRPPKGKFSQETGHSE